MIFSIVGQTPDGSAVGCAAAGHDLAAVLMTVDVAEGTVVAQGDDAQGEGGEQAGVVDGQGGTATTTGAACPPWAGGLHGPDRSGAFAVQGMGLPGPDVVDEMVAAWRDSDRAAPLARRLVAALRAGQDAGGSTGGVRSAGVLVVSPGGGGDGLSDVVVDLRSGDSPDPLAELERLLDLQAHP